MGVKNRNTGNRLMAAIFCVSFIGIALMAVRYFEFVVLFPEDVPHQGLDVGEVPLLRFMIYRLVKVQKPGSAAWAPKETMGWKARPSQPSAAYWDTI